MEIRGGNGIANKVDAVDSTGDAEELILQLILLILG